jgi:hypothetical protein
MHLLLRSFLAFLHLASWTCTCAGELGDCKSPKSFLPLTVAGSGFQSSTRPFCFEFCNLAAVEHFQHCPRNKVFDPQKRENVVPQKVSYPFPCCRFWSSSTQHLNPWLPTLADWQRWSSPSTWPSGRVPGLQSRENVVIPCGQAVLLDVPNLNLGLLNISGHLM